LTGFAAGFMARTWRRVCRLCHHHFLQRLRDRSTIVRHKFQRGSFHAKAVPQANRKLVIINDHEPPSRTPREMAGIHRELHQQRQHVNRKGLRNNSCDSNTYHQHGEIRKGSLSVLVTVHKLQKRVFRGQRDDGKAVRNPWHLAEVKSFCRQIGAIGSCLPLLVLFHELAKVNVKQIRARVCLQQLAVNLETSHEP
jgi:hypothetical protein